MEKYPVIRNGERVGTLTVEQDGLMSVFTAEAEDDGELLRVSVYGGDSEGYLGVMVPENGMLRIKKRLSRAAMWAFPEKIEYAAPSGEKPGEKIPEKAETENVEATEAAPKPPLDVSVPQETATTAPPVMRKLTAPEILTGEQMSMFPEARFESGDLVWFSAPDGTLSAFDGRQMLLAIPAAGTVEPQGHEHVIRRIEGREYIVFKR